MKFLHIADLHLGRLLYGRSLIEDQRHFLFECLLPAIDRHKPDVLLIAGDLYDGRSPPPKPSRCLTNCSTRSARGRCPPW